MHEIVDDVKSKLSTAIYQEKDKHKVPFHSAHTHTHIQS